MEWAADVPKYAQLPFYPAFAQLTEAFLREDAALLRELVGAEEDDRAADDGADTTNEAAQETRHAKEA